MSTEVIALAKALGGLFALTVAIWSRSKSETSGPSIPVPRPSPIPVISAYDPLPPQELEVESWSMWDGDEFDEDGERTDAYISTDYRFTCGDRVGKAHVPEYEHYVTVDVTPPMPVQLNAQYHEPPYRDPMLQAIVRWVVEHFPERQLEMHCLGAIVTLQVEQISQQNE